MSLFGSHADAPQSWLREERTPTQRVVRALGAVAALIVCGATGYMLIEGWDLHTAIYFTIITVTTVGYGDYGLSEAGQQFTVFLILGGFGLFTYCCGQIIETVNTRQLMRRRKMQRAIRSLTDHMIICGLGRMGWTIAERLCELGVPFVAIDQNEQYVERALERGWLAKRGDATDDDVLQGAAIDSAKALFCAASRDADNIVVTLSARDINPELYILSRAEEPGAIRKLKRAGVSKVISPIGAGADRAVDSVLKPHLTEILDGIDSEAPIEMAEIRITDALPDDWRSVEACGRRHPSVAFVAVRRPDGGITFRLRPGERLDPGDVLIVAGEQQEVCSMALEAREMGSAAA